MRRRKNGSKWMVIATVAILAALAWNAYRTPTDAPITIDPPPAASTGSTATQDARTATHPLELPPPMVAATADAGYPDFLPPEAIDTLTLIAQGGPYPYRQDDGVFGNREGRLPRQARDYYREYTVKTPGSHDRGARRIVAGGRPPVEYFYTDDHYDSFRRFVLDNAEPSR